MCDVPLTLIRVFHINSFQYNTLTHTTKYLFELTFIFVYLEEI